MKSICVDTRFLGFSGIGSYLKNLLPLLVNEPYRWIFLTKKGASLSFPFLHAGEILETDIPVLSLRELTSLHRIIPSCDLFWSPHFNGPLIPPPAKKQLITFHDPYHQVFFKTLNPHEKLYTKFLLPRMLKRADQLITVSEFSKQEIVRHNPFLHNKLCAIHNGINHSIFFPDTAGSSPYPAPYFLSVGSLKKHKNAPRLIEAFQKTSDHHTYHLVVCGSNKEMHNALPSIKSTPRIHTVSHISDDTLRTLYSHAAGFIFPSYYEGFGFPPLEAMASGCPTITANVASLPEICGDATHYIDPFSPHSIEEAIIRFTHDAPLRTTLQQKGISQASLFSWEKSAEQHLKQIEVLLTS